MKNKLLVSACLMGFQVRYNGSEKAQLAATLSRWQQAGRLVIHCPELAAGLPTPRLPAEILGGTGGDVLAGRARIVESDGRDVTEHYQLAAWLALSAARKRAVRQRYSPTAALPAAASLSMTVPFRGRRKAGAGVAADLLRAHGITVFSDGQIPQLLAWMAQKSRMMIQCKRVYDPQEAATAIGCWSTVSGRGG
ncbi:Purine nucleoside phosphorylase [Klebsiella pneumoniae subsp. rhinoscleromatis]|nr:Purine nucleoside phosphorylase [Klebsiella pneumoniae subsp. rhinoscleromatis]